MRRDDAVKIVQRHYKRLQTSPAPVDNRRYAMLVLEDVIADLKKGVVPRGLRPSGVLPKPKLLLESGGPSDGQRIEADAIDKANNAC